jgi:hypothetical protein
MTSFGGLDQLSSILQMEGARKVMNHLQFQPDFIERTLATLFGGASGTTTSTLPTSIASAPTVVATSAPSSKVSKAEKPKRKYTKGAQGSAWADFAKSHRAEITAQVKEEGVEAKKVAGEVGKRLGALWKQAKENPKSGENTPPSDPTSPKAAPAPQWGDKKVMLDLGSGEVECTIKGTEVWFGGKQIGEVSEGEEGEEYSIFEEEE